MSHLPPWSKVGGDFSSEEEEDPAQPDEPLVAGDRRTRAHSYDESDAATAPHRGCCLRAFDAMHALTILLALAAAAGEAVDIFFSKSDTQFDRVRFIALRVFAIVFCLLIVVVEVRELGCCSAKREARVSSKEGRQWSKSWIVRGLAYLYVGLACTETSILCDSEFDNEAAEDVAVYAGFGLCVMGLFVALLGVFCCDQLKQLHLARLRLDQYEYDDLDKPHRQHASSSSSSSSNNNSAASHGATAQRRAGYGSTRPADDQDTGPF